MSQKLIAGATICALCWMSVAPVSAQEHRFAGFDAPRGTTAAVRVRIPLGGSEPRTRRPSVAFTVDRGIEQGGADGRGATATRQLRMLEFTVDRAGLQRARLAGFDIGTAGERLRLGGEGNAKNSIILFFAFFLCVLTGVILLDDAGDGGRRAPPDSVPQTPTPPTGG